MRLLDLEQVTQLDDPLSKKSQQLLNTVNTEEGFDYAVLSQEVRILVQSKTSELKSLIRRNAQDIVDIGQKLTEVKEQLGYGNFRIWLNAEFDWSVRTANRFMQVATQFKSANLAHLNIAVSALYLLAQPSTPEKARKEVLELAKECENITYAKAKAVVNHYQEQAQPQPNVLKLATIDISTKAIESNSSTPSEQNESPQIHSQLEPKPDKRLEQKALEKIDSVPKEYSEASNQLQLEISNHVRVLNIEYQNPELVTNIAQAFELSFAGVRVDVEGSPEPLIMLFKQMQNNPAFTEKVLQEAKLLSDR